MILCAMSYIENGLHSDAEQYNHECRQALVINCKASKRQTVLNSTKRHAKSLSISILTHKYLIFFRILFVCVKNTIKKWNQFWNMKQAWMSMLIINNSFQMFLKMCYFFNSQKHSISTFSNWPSLTSTWAVLKVRSFCLKHSIL